MATEYINKQVALDSIKLAYGQVSKDPFDCSEAFEELIAKINKETKVLNITESQLRALRVAVGDAQGSDMHRPLNELYHNIKKMMIYE